MGVSMNRCMCVQGKGKRKSKRADATPAGTNGVSDTPFRPLKTLDVFAGCGGKDCYRYVCAQCNDQLLQQG